MRWIQYSLVLATFILLSGCNQIDSPERLMYPAAVPPDDLTQTTSHNGSIYQNSQSMSLFEDKVAKNVGDLLTIRLEVAMSAQKQAKTKTTKSDVNTEGPLTIFSIPMSTQYESTSSQAFSGDGQTNQNNSLTGTFSVTVKKVYSNGNLFVQGESWITLNEGREYVRLSGIVRPEDIEAGNVVSSQRVAAANISYSGYGQVGNTSHPGLFSKLINRFFPF